MHMLLTHGKPHLTKLLTACVIAATLIGCQGSGEETVTDGSDEVISGSGATDINLQIGNGGGSSFQGGTANADLTSVDTEQAAWEISVVLADNNGLIVADSYTVNFASTCVTSGLATLSATSVTTVAGRASTTYTSGTCTGVDTVIASLTVSGTRLSAAADLNIDGTIESAGGGTSVNALTMGSGTGTAFTAGVLTTSQTTLQAGGTTIISANVVNSEGEPYTFPEDVSFGSGCVSQGLASFGDPNTVANGGLAQTTYTAQGCSGEDTITARSEIDGQALEASVTLNIAVDTVLAVNFISNSDSVLAIAGIGGQETSVVTFKVVGAQGAPIVGETVSFELSNTIGGAQLAEGSETGTTNNSGEVSTVVQSGTVNSSLRVNAIHDTTGIQGLSNDITISTGIPISSGFDLSLNPANPNAWNRNNTEVEIIVNASDQFGNPPPDGTRVSFRSVEVGTIPGSCELLNGTCSVTWVSSGDRNHITPEAGGDMRIGRATVIGFMSGAENFVDHNANGLFDPDIPAEAASLVDLPEAFTDQNENGIFDSGEDFIDSFLNNPAPSDSVTGGRNEAYDAVGDGNYNGPCSELIRSDCPPNGLQSTTISDSVTISLSSSTVAICSDDSDIMLTNTLSTPFTVSNLSFCDENGNSLPEGTTISFDSDGLDLIGASNWVVPNDTTEPTPNFNFVIETDGENTDRPTFSISVFVPDESTVNYGWSVTENP
ncbi:MAG: hypothetical protein K6L76_11920 [Agarilytica sp.]